MEILARCRCMSITTTALKSCQMKNPTIGILLCASKNDAVVKFTLPENNQTIVASKYQLYLPTEQQLIAEINKKIKNHKE